MSVLAVMRWNIRPEKAREYGEWARESTRRTLGVPGCVEFRAWRPVTGNTETVITYEFPDLSAWAKWRESAEVQAVTDEMRPFVSDLVIELWGPSPVVPAPIRPGR